MQTNRNTLRLTQLALLGAIEVILAITPLGLIPLPTISITLLHIPVIIGAILLGPLDGGILGFIMGVCSMAKAIFAPSSATSYLINPFTSGNPLASLAMTIIPRILIGVVAGYTYRYLSKTNTPTWVSVGISAFLGTLTNTVLFLGSLSIFFSSFPLINILALVVGINTVSEMIAAVVISIGVCLPVMRYMKKRIVT